MDLDGGGRKPDTKFYMHDGKPYIYNPRMVLPGKRVVLTRNLTLKTVDGMYIRNFKSELATNEFIQWYIAERQKVFGSPKQKKQKTMMTKTTKKKVPSKSKQVHVPHKTIRHTTKRSRDKNLNIYRSSLNLQEIGLKEGDFLNDVCYVLKKMKNKLNILVWDEDSVLQFKNALPYVREKRKSDDKVKLFSGDITKSKNTHLYLGNDNLQLEKLIGEGTYGKIYNAIFGKTKAAVKINKQRLDSRAKALDYYSEIIIQNELFCLTRGQLGPSMAKIPKPLFICKYKHNSDNIPLVGMEPLQVSVSTFISTLNRAYRAREAKVTKQYCTKQIIHMLYSVANTLEYLQDKFEFIHRDLHIGNIMAKMTRGELPQWHIIDFGMSTMMVNGERINDSKHCCSEMYDKGVSDKHYNKCHDMRQFFFSLIHYDDYKELETILDDVVYGVFNGLYDYLRKQIKSHRLAPEFSNLCHKLYGDAIVKMNSPIFEPAAFKCILDKMSVTKQYLR